MVSFSCCQRIVRCLWRCRYNAHRGNAEEDVALISLIHGLMRTVIKRGSIPKLSQLESSTTPFKIRLVDVGSKLGQDPRVVEMVDQSPPYIALSHGWGASQAGLRRSNLKRFQESVQPSEIQEWQAAIDLTRKLGMQYIWIESLCVVQDDLNERLSVVSNLGSIYTSCAGVLVKGAAETNKTPLHWSMRGIDCQPCSLYLNWSYPKHASSFTKCLQTDSWNWASRSWTYQEILLSNRLMRRVRKLAFAAEVWALTEGLSAPIAQNNQRINPRYTDQSTQTHEEVHGDEYDLANTRIEEGVDHVNASCLFEALASFTAAKDIVSVSKSSSPRSLKIHAVASAGIALIYLKQNLPVIASDIVDRALAASKDLSLTASSSALE